MTSKEINICGKPVTICYCFATEICYKVLTDEDINDFVAEAINAINKKRMPDTKRTLNFILAGLTAYYESLSKKKKAPVTDTMLLTEMTPDEMGTALGTLIGLRAEFYHVPSDEPKDKQSKLAEEKND